MTALHVLEVAAGAVLVAATFYDLFQSVILPRPAIGKLLLGPLFVRWTWRAWRWVGNRRRVDKRENFLAIFAPLGLISMLVFWALGLILGYALVLSGLADQLRPPLDSFGAAVYFAAVSLLTLGFGDIVPVGSAARPVALLAAGSGLGLVALVISLLFSLYGAFQRREESVITLDALAGAPPSGLQILENVRKFEMPEQLASTFNEWRTWTAAVLESHLAYPILIYFRSSHDNEAWLNSFGAVMDAATLAISTLEDGVEGTARLMHKVGGHLVEDFSWYFRLENSREPGIEREEFTQARARLIKAGYRCRGEEEAWQKFSGLRAEYASPLNRMALYLAIQPAQWIGDRSYLPHRVTAGALQRPPASG